MLMEFPTKSNFPERFLVSSNFSDEDIYTIKELKTVNNDEHYLRLSEKEGLLKLSKTNTNDLRTLFLDNCTGKRIIIYKTQIKVNGEWKNSLKIKVPVRQLL